MAEEVAIVDFSPYSLDREEPDPETIQRLVDGVHGAFTSLGFVYLKNHGISTASVEKVFDVSRRFFHLEISEKLPYAKPNDDNHGYREMEKERLDHARKIGDLKEAFGYRPHNPDVPVPDKEVPDFGASFRRLFDATVSLLNRILEVIAMGLQLEDSKYFVKRGKFIPTGQNLTNLSSFYYPELTSRDIKGDQTRCGEHSDFGALTLLFQDSQEGLEVKTRDGQWIRAPPIQDTVLVNIGDLMQRWTSDRLIACKHRVVLPLDETHRRQARQSLALFGNPDNETLVECLDNSNKYPPIKACDYLKRKYNDMYESS